MVWRDQVALGLALPLIAVAVIAYLGHQLPNVLVAGDQESWAVFDQDAEILHIADGVGDFQRSIWMGRFGIRPEDKDQRVKVCETDPCRLSVGSEPRQTRIIIASKLSNPFYACRNADIVVTLKTDLPRQTCLKAGAGTMIDDDVLWWQGGVVFDAEKIVTDRAGLETVRQTSGHWPWIVIGGQAGRSRH
jgi:competence protein ComEC